MRCARNQVSEFNCGEVATFEVLNVAFFRQSGRRHPMQTHFLWKIAICYVILSVRVIAQDNEHDIKQDPSCSCAAQLDCTSCVIGQSPQRYPLQTMFQARNTVEKPPEHERYSTVTFKRRFPCNITCSWNRRLETCSDTNFQLLPDNNLVPPFDLENLSPFTPGLRYDLYIRFKAARYCQDSNGK